MILPSIISSVPKVTFTDDVSIFNPNMFGNVDTSKIYLFVSNSQIDLKGSGSSYKMPGYDEKYLSDDTKFCDLTFKGVYILVDASGYGKNDEDQLQDDIEYYLKNRNLHSFAVIVPNNIESDEFIKAIKTALDNFGAEDGTVSLYLTGATGQYTINIPSGAFQGCTALKSVVVADGISKIKDGAFKSCTELVSVIVENGVTSIDADAFRFCAKLETVIVEEGVTSIGADAFRVCKKLETVFLPHSLNSISAGAFCDCTAITYFKYNGTKDEFSAIRPKTAEWIPSTVTVKCTDGTWSQ